MTAEICMMNRLAVVLAADSATTVSSWNGKRREERYFKGANKIFQLSNVAPVGIMIFDSADMLRVPWEIIIKSFREHLGSKTFNELNAYAEEFFTYLSDNQRLFPEEVQAEALVAAANLRARSWMREAAREEADDFSAILVQKANAESAKLDSLPFAAPLSQEVRDQLWGDYGDAIHEEVAGVGDKLEIAGAVIQDLSATALTYVLKHPENSLPTTGLVFTGFGDHEIFPAMVEYLSSGIVAGQHIYRRESGMEITHDTPAWISAFAQTSMTDTFSLGLSQDVYSSLIESLVSELSEFASKVAEKCGVANFDVDDDDFDKLLEATCRKVGDGVLDKARDEHAMPLRSVIGVLPVDEMAELAETLIHLQSLKEKVTKPSETVGGPVDVAIITKHEGLVWIKRKHFFDASKNSRYMLRQAALYR